MIWLALSWLKKGAYASLCVITRRPWQCALIASLCLVGWLYRGREAARDELATFQAAQREATAKAIAARKAEEARHIQRAERIDREADTLKADYRARTDGYVSRMRCPSNQASGTVATSPNQDTGSADSSGGAPELVAVIADDLRICADNTGRLEKAREWALGLGG